MVGLALEQENQPKVHNHPPLEEVLAYHNQDIIDGFLKSLDVTEEEANNIFKDTLKWLWYCRHPDTQGSRTIDKNLLIIDEMWHTFILYTNDYFKFCHKYFGMYIHHSPTRNSEIEEYKKLTPEERTAEKRRQLELVYDVLGKETFISWYHLYPQKYTYSSILELRKK
ncbi:hypothetical protein N480_18330 [Pseudoalteromonas luteoviolacea S2607]|uniref:hypothetical protein n=1 Tax=Pseudoalteromonas luteoviolacea TaxID=43657 RepID=UPI0007B07EBC|nr:hypothetical protein [Pseudoalteromonas luteoviolacea]KZN35948.1 hypothetical protein N480_18330 [Pseudoalteromonas luteoviolacea S2607]